MGSIHNEKETEMNRPSFAKGLYVEYKNCHGKIRFISEYYITICIQTNSDKSKDVCIVVPPYEWDNVKLSKESGK